MSIRDQLESRKANRELARAVADKALAAVLDAIETLPGPIQPIAVSMVMAEFQIATRRADASEKGTHNGP